MRYSGSGYETTTVVPHMLLTYSLSLELILARTYHPLILPHFATCAATPLHRTRKPWIVESHTKCVQWYLMAGRYTVTMGVGCVSMGGNVQGEGDQRR